MVNLSISLIDTREATERELHSGIVSYEHQHKIGCISDAMGDYGHGQISAGCQIHESQQKAHQAFVDDSGYALICVRQSERDVNHYQADDPGRARAIEQIGY